MAADRDTDGLYDTSEPAMQNRIERFKRRIVESPIDRACQSLALAGDDVNAAIHLVSNRKELTQMRDVILETIARLETSWSVAMVIDEYWEHRQ